MKTKPKTTTKTTTKTTPKAKSRAKPKPKFDPKSTTFAIESSQEPLSATARVDGMEFTVDLKDDQPKAETLLPIVEECLELANITSGDIQTGVYSRGPGSFTSIRMAMTFFGGLRAAHSISVFGVSSLATLSLGAFRATDVNKIIACVDARGGEAYIGAYEFGESSVKTLIPDSVQNPNDLNDDTVVSMLKMLREEDDVALVGVGWHRFRDQFTRALGDTSGFHQVIDKDVIYLRPSSVDLIGLAGLIGVEGLDDPDYLRSGL